MYYLFINYLFIILKHIGNENTYIDSKKMNQIYVNSNLCQATVYINLRYAQHSSIMYVPVSTVTCPRNENTMSLLQAT